jgi:hypothetical protein
MKRFLSFLLVRRPETENKWWHRLFTVLLFGSALVALVISVFLTIDSYNHTWITHKPVAFSLESNYQDANGKELSCEQDIFMFPTSSNEPAINGAGIKCDGVTLTRSDSKRYEALYEAERKDLEKQFGLDKYNLTNCPRSLPGERLSPEQISCIRENLDAEQADPEYPKYQSALKDLLRIKVVKNINYEFMLTDIGLWVAIPLLTVLLWIVFWSAIIYRSVLYIIFGKRK